MRVLGRIIKSLQFASINYKSVRKCKTRQSRNTRIYQTSHLFLDKKNLIYLEKTYRKDFYINFIM